MALGVMSYNHELSLHVKFLRPTAHTSASQFPPRFGLD